MLIIQYSKYVDQAIDPIDWEEVTDHIWENKLEREKLLKEQKIRQFSDFKTILPYFEFNRGRHNENVLEIHCDQFSSDDDSAYDESLGLEYHPKAINYPPLYNTQAVHFDDHSKESHCPLLKLGQKM